MLRIAAWYYAGLPSSYCSGLGDVKINVVGRRKTLSYDDPKNSNFVVRTLGKAGLSWVNARQSWVMLG